MFIRLFLIVILFPLQSCSNTLIGEKLENSFDTNENAIISEKINNKPQKLNEIPTLVDSNISNPMIGLKNKLEIVASCFDLDSRF